MRDSIVSINEEQFNIIKSIISKSARDLMDVAKKEFNKDLKYVSCLNVIAALHGYETYDRLTSAVRNDANIKVVSIFSSIDYELGVDKAKRAFIELTEKEKNQAINFLINKERSILVDRGLMEQAIPTTQSVINREPFKADYSLSNEENFELLASWLRLNHSFGRSVSISKRKLSESWQFAYVHIPVPTSDFGVNVFMDIRPQKDLAASVELVCKGGKAAIDFFDSFLERANECANSSPIDDSIQYLASDYVTPTNKNYLGQPKKDFVFFQSPQGSLYGVSTVLDGAKCTQAAHYKGWLPLSLIEDAVADLFKIVNFVINS